MGNIFSICDGDDGLSEYFKVAPWMAVRPLASNILAPLASAVLSGTSQFQAERSSKSVDASRGCFDLSTICSDQRVARLEAQGTNVNSFGTSY